MEQLDFESENPFFDVLRRGFGKLALDLRWPRLTSLLDIPCSILDIQSHSCAGPEGGNLPLIGHSCLPVIMRIADCLRWTLGGFRRILGLCPLPLIQRQTLQNYPSPG